MKIYLLDEFINNSEIENTTSSSKFSKINYNKNSYLEWLTKALTNNNFEVSVQNTGFIPPSHETCFLFSMRCGIDLLYIKELKSISKHLCTRVDWIFSDNNDAVSFFYKDSDASPFKLPLNHSIKDLNDLDQIEKFIAQGKDTRSINDIKFENGQYTKYSKDKVKLKAEYNFLKNIPEVLSYFYIDVHDWNESEETASYKMPRLLDENIAELCRTDQMSEINIKTVFKSLYNYINLTIKSKISTTSSFSDWLINKNNKRFTLFKNHSSYSLINNSFSNLCSLDLEEYRKQINKVIFDNKKEMDSISLYFSHGDLCLSNILFNQKSNKITLIDPRGSFFDKESFNFNVLYDLAKLSHSILGIYDDIVGDYCQIKINNDLSFNVSSLYRENNKSCDLMEYYFKDLLIKLNINIKLVRLVEASLFFSMIPLHLDKPSKAVLLLLNSNNILKSCT